MKSVLIILTVLTLAAFAWWTISPFFIDKEVNDALPENLELGLQKTDSSTTGSKLETVVRGPFPIEDTVAHPASGNVYLITSSDETVIRYENYDGTNGPDLKVYLAKDLDANEYVNLGTAKGNKGNINYDVPSGVNIGEYRYILTWCEAFGVLFDYAEIF